jgi:ketosteroid isomerase-like protein
MRPFIQRLFLACFVLFATVSALRAESLNASDKAAVVAVITDQLKAFAADDGPAAYAHAAPIVKGAFRTVDTFMTMVKKGYQPVYRNKGYTFGESFSDGMGRPAQRVILRGLDGKNYEASYFMEKQSDGTWMIAGCVLLVLPGTEV